MATTILLVLFVTLVLRATLSFPVSQDVKLVQLLDNAGNVEPSKRTVVSDHDAILRRIEDTDQVKSLDSVTPGRAFDANSVKRTKREVIDGYHSCAEGMRWFWNMCVTLEKYKELNEGDDYVEEN